MIIATFGSSTGWDGKHIVFDGTGFVVEGQGAVAASAVVGYVSNSQASWASPDTQQLTLTMVAQQAQAPPAPAGQQSGGWSNVRGWLGSPTQLIILAALVFVMFVLWAFVSQMH